MDGRLTCSELVDRFDASTRQGADALDPSDRESWASHRKDLRAHVGEWLESRRRHGLVEGELGATNVFGKASVEPEWRLTEAGRVRAGAISDERHIVPASLIGAVGETALDGLRTALKTAIAAFPTLVLAWMVGLIQHPSAPGFAVAGVAFVAAVALAVSRVRAVNRAHNPRRREIERVGRDYAGALGPQADRTIARREQLSAEIRRDNEALAKYVADLDVHFRAEDAEQAAWRERRESWDEADPATRGPEPTPPAPRDPPVVPDGP